MGKKKLYTKQKYRLISGGYAVKLGAFSLDSAFDKRVLCYDEYQNRVKSGEYEIMARNCVLPDDTGGKTNNTIIKNVITHDILFVKEEHLVSISRLHCWSKHCACCGAKL